MRRRRPASFTTSEDGGENARSTWFAAFRSRRLRGLTSNLHSVLVPAAKERQHREKKKKERKRKLAFAGSVTGVQAVLHASYSSDATSEGGVTLQIPVLYRGLLNTKRREHFGAFTGRVEGDGGGITLLIQLPRKGERGYSRLPTTCSPSESRIITRQLFHSV